MLFVQQGHFDTIRSGGIPTVIDITMVGKPSDIELSDTATQLQALHVQNFQQVENDADVLAEIYPEGTVCYKNQVNVDFYIVIGATIFEIAKLQSRNVFVF